VGGAPKLPLEYDDDVGLGAGTRQTFFRFSYFITPTTRFPQCYKFSVSFSRFHFTDSQSSSSSFEQRKSQEELFIVLAPADN
jgi:hypothetical protein